MAPAILAAEFTNGSKTRPACLTLNRIANGRRDLVASFPVSGKREARQIAAKHAAKPWNF